MSFQDKVMPVPYDILYEQHDEEKANGDIIWGIPSQVVITPNEAQKRKTPNSVVLAKKKAKMTRTDEKILDEKARDAARILLDQISETPGQISLNFETPESSSVCPLPSDLGQKVPSQWSIKQLQDGQLNSLLTEDVSLFKPLGISKIQKGIVRTQVLPREFSLETSLQKLKNENRSSDHYVGFGIGVCSILRKCDADTAEKLAQSITETIEKNAADLNKN